MSRKEVPRAGLLKAALAGKISNGQGALAMQVSLRQFQRAKVRFVVERTLAPSAVHHEREGTDEALEILRGAGRLRTAAS